MSTVLKLTFSLGFGALLFLACSSGQGDSCSTDNDCGANLTCQPVHGRDQNFCCPTPAEASDYQNCHPVQGATPTPAPAPTTAPADAATGG
jgi:hypothetical protein